MDYGTHKELCAYGLVPGIIYEELKEQFEFCKKVNAPFVLATHYWEVLKNNNLKDIYIQFLNFVQNQGVKNCFVDECYD
jgi:hypothetical protein